MELHVLAPVHQVNIPKPSQAKIHANNVLLPAVTVQVQHYANNAQVVTIYTTAHVFPPVL